MPTDTDPVQPLPCICLAGPTASGKTACALAIAQTLSPEYPIEVISVDSALVYRGMDIGTAKPTPAERAVVFHHLIDIIEPNESYSAARFVLDAKQLIMEIRARQHWPLLVGGTMLYFKALFEGLDAMPPADPVVRAALAAQLERDGLHALHTELQRVDPSMARRLAPGDTQRILRALEVFRISGQRLSSLQQRGNSPTPPTHPLLISLEPMDRQVLHQRIEERFHQMVASGFLDEVKRLMARGDLHPDLPSMRCVGYRQAWEALQSNESSVWVDRSIAATRQLAKRQLTWLRSMHARRVVACDAADAASQTVTLAHEALLALRA